MDREQVATPSAMTLRDSTAALAGEQKPRGAHAPALLIPSRCQSRLLRCGHVEDQRTEDLRACGIGVLQTHEEVADGVLLFLRTVVAVSREGCTNLVERTEILDGIPDVVSEVAIGADVFHGEAVSNNDAVGGELLENGLIVFLPGLAEIAALARFHLEEIIAGERK